MITEKLAILVVEDTLSDYKLIEYQIRKIVENPLMENATTFEEFKKSIEQSEPDIIISDYKLLGYTGMDVLNYAQKQFPETAFIFITGTIQDEEIAANTILNGVSGYILKNNLGVLNEKLLPVFKKVIEKRTEKKSPLIKDDILDNIDSFINNAKKEDSLLVDGYKQLKKSLEQLKKNKS